MTARKLQKRMTAASEQVPVALAAISRARQAMLEPFPHPGSIGAALNALITAEEALLSIEAGVGVCAPATLFEGGEA